MTVVALVPAAGRGERLGPGQPKALRPLLGEPLLVHAVRRLAAADLVDEVIVAVPPDRTRDVAAMLDGADIATRVRVRVVAGGETRVASVRAMLDALSDLGRPRAVQLAVVDGAGYGCGRQSQEGENLPYLVDCGATVTWAERKHGSTASSVSGDGALVRECHP